jgi:serralysin
MAKFIGKRFVGTHHHEDETGGEVQAGLLDHEVEGGYHGDFGIGRVVSEDGDVVFTGTRAPQEASVDGQGGTIRDKPVFTIDEAAFYLNRGDGLFTIDGVTYGSGANWDGAQGFDNDYYFTNAGKANGGKAVSSGQPGGTGVADGALTTINYGFYETLATLPEPYVYNRAGDGALVVGFAVARGFSAFSEAQKAATREAMASWDDLVAVKFVETNFRQGDINFMNTTTGPAQASAYLPYDYGVSTTKKFNGENVSFYEIAGDVYVAAPSVNASNGALDEGQYGLTTLIHEVGHSLGLEHPGAYNFGPGFAVTYENGAEYYQDSNMYSIMSYWDAEETGGHNVDWQYMNYNYAATPMVHDIAAIQRIYGADMTTRTGDSTYGFNVSADVANRDAYDFVKTPLPIMSIWDAGGIDTLDLSGFNTNSVIDLTPGSYSSAGGFFSPTFPTLAEINARRAADNRPPRTQAQYDQYVTLFADTYTNGLLTDNIGIAYGAIIENAVGGGGDDIITGNDVANILSGKAGKDTITAGLGNDTLVGGAGGDVLDGGEGIDIASYRDAAGPVTLTVNSAGRATVSGDGVGDTYISIEGYEGSSFGDTMTGTTAKDILFGGSGDDNISGGNADDQLDGGAGNDRVDGGNGTDLLFGRAGVDTLLGGSGNDILDGGAGADTLSGGSGNDVFIFQSVADLSGDKVLDFAISADKLDISRLYSSAAAQSGFALRTDGKLQDAYDVAFTSSGGKTFVFGDVDGNGTEDFRLELNGTLKLKASDFIVNQTQWNDFFAKIGNPTDYSALHTDVLL